MKPIRFFALSLAAAGLLLPAGCSSEVAAIDTSEASRGRAATVVIPERTVLIVRTTGTLSTATQESGQTFTAHLAEPLIYNGRTMAPKGAEVRGMVAIADKGGRIKNVAAIGVRLTALNTAHGFVEISTNTLTQTAGTTKRNDAIKIAIGSGVGAAIGAIAGGGKGAAIGAAAGGGAGTGVVLATRGDAAVIPSESVLTFTLRRPVMVVGD